MTNLAVFSAAEAELIISLPYKVGINISYAEDEGGELDDKLEMLALNASINAIAKLQEGCAFTKEVAGEILNSKDKYEAWTQGVFNLEPQCAEVITLLKSQASEGEIKAYIKMVLEIASSVAQAYGEFGEEENAPEGFFGSVMSKIVSGLSAMKDDDVNHPMNISAAENSAIARISAALTSVL